MKAKVGSWGKYTLFVLVTACIAGGILLAADAGLGDAAAGWFESQFIRHTEDTYTRLDGTLQSIYCDVFQWERLRSFLLALGLVLAFLWALSVAAAMALRERKAAGRAVEKSSELIRDIFSQSEAAALAVSKEYESAVACGRELKSRMAAKEWALQQEAAQKNDLIAYLAHDLKTPLTSVVGYLSLLEEAPDMPAEQKAKYVHTALDKALRLEKLINELFEITRYNLHEILLETETVNLSYMLAQMADEFYPVLVAHGNTIRVTADDGLKVIADPAKLARVFNNILKNAVAYSDPDTAIEIGAAQHNGIMRITFTNIGRTIPGQKLDAIFEKFYRLDDSRSGSTGGSGLGLAIAREIVTAHGGTITASSENRVTVFTVELPLSGPQEKIREILPVS